MQEPYPKRFGSTMWINISVIIVVHTPHAFFSIHSRFFTISICKYTFFISFFTHVVQIIFGLPHLHFKSLSYNSLSFLLVRQYQSLHMTKPITIIIHLFLNICNFKTLSYIFNFYSNPKVYPLIHRNIRIIVTLIFRLWSFLRVQPFNLMIVW